MSRVGNTQYLILNTLPEGSLLARAKWVGRERLIRGLYGRVAVRRSRRRGRSASIERILVIRPDHLGDLLFATPALDMLREAFPGAHITGAVGPWGRAMWAGNPKLDALEVVPFPGIAGERQGGPLSPYFLLGDVARRLARGRYDLGITLRFDHWWGAAFMWAAGIPRRWGYDVPGMAAWLTDAVPYVSGRHEVEQNVRLVQAVIEAEGVGVSRPKVVIRREEGRPSLRPPQPLPVPEGIAKEWLGAERRAVIHPGTGAANKLWTIGGWAEVADRLAAEGWRVALTGSPDERRLAELIWEAAQSNPLNLAGQTANLDQLVWLLDQAEMALGVDSGPLHIAAALGKPTLHIYGPSDETIWGPWGDPARHRALRAPGTQPTMRLEVGSTELEGGPEMRAISVEMVMEALPAK